MMLHRISCFLAWFIISIAPGKSTIAYQCAPFPVESQCVIEQISYHPGQQVTFPAGYQFFRIGPAKHMKGYVSNVTIFDKELYEALHRPAYVEMTRVNLKRVVLPPELNLGEFADNDINTLEVRDQPYRITYLDLDSNHFSNISNISALVNLETLHLRSNGITVIREDVFIPLTQLKRLFLNYNQFSTFPWKGLPIALRHLDCYIGSIITVEFSGLNFPALEYLNLEGNEIERMDVYELLRAAPALKEAHLGHNRIDSQAMAKIEETLELHNISFSETSQYESCYDEDKVFVGGKCIQRQKEPISTWKAMLLSVMTITIAVLFVYIVFIVFRQMN